MAATLFEDALDIAASDPEAASALLSHAVDEMVRYTFWSARAWQPRAKDVLRRLGEIDGEVERLARAFYRAVGTQERLTLAGALFARSGVSTGFFEWESEPEDT
jgi:truncated hemoglobin YjbI